MGLDRIDDADTESCVMKCVSQAHPVSAGRFHDDLTVSTVMASLVKLVDQLLIALGRLLNFYHGPVLIRRGTPGGTHRVLFSSVVTPPIYPNS